MEALPLLSALLLGALHTFETDHMAAVGAFVARRPAPAAAIGYGVRWAAGHGGIVVLAGSALLLFGISVPPSAGTWLERLVGASLVALGAWVALARRPRHSHTHGAPTMGGAGAASRAALEHGPASTAMGALHGLAGTAPVVALLPVAQGSSALGGTLFLVAFAAGTALAMGGYALLAGVVVGRALDGSFLSPRRLARAAGALTAAVGVWWMLGGAP